ncbi:histidine--tRNA ligase [Candidatus Woesearchaeota archaeon]|nr:histidine--tRNA ligase [Candidatus Woesearchaeota archaeon]
MYQAVKGMEDYYPQQKAAQQAIFAKLRQSAQRFGFLEVEPPAVETLSLLTAKSGEEVRQQIFVFDKKGSEELGLRFDLTVPMTRMFVAVAKQVPKPVKWFALQKMWRYEAPQKGRLREFSQLSVELFGSDKPEADAEIINLLIAGLTSLGLTEQDFYVKVNSRKLLEGLLTGIVPKSKFEAVTRLIDKSAKITETAFAEALLMEGLNQEEINDVRNIVTIKGSWADVKAAIRKLRVSKEAEAGIQEVDSVLSLVDDKCVVVDLSVARGLAYYTGMVYEVFDREGKFRAIAGGGRYDNLIELFGGEKTSACGAAIGEATLTLLLKEKGLLPDVKQGPDYYIAPVSESEIPAAMKLAAKLREKNTVDVDLMRRKVGKQFDYANTINAAKVIVIGPDEIKKGVVKVKDMKTGNETESKLPE